MMIWINDLYPRIFEIINGRAVLPGASPKAHSLLVPQGIGQPLL